MNDTLAPLRVPLVALAHDTDIDGFDGLTPAQLDRIREAYAPAELALVRAAIAAALDDESIDLRPYAFDLPFDNAQLRGYLTKLRTSPDAIG